MIPGRRRATLVTVILVCLLVVIVHLPLRRSAYIQDDHLAVESNRIVQRGNFAEIFSSTYWEGASGEDNSLYRPVTIGSFAIERKLSGEPSALLSQIVNILLHLGCCLMLFLLVRRLGANRFTCTATLLLFAVHPIHVEAIAGIVGRAEILAALFSFAALWLMTHTGEWRLRDGTGSPSSATARLAAWAAAAALFLGLGSKEVALATPLLLLALEFLFRPRPPGRAAGWWIDRGAALAPSALAAMVFIIMRVRALEQLFALQPAHSADNPLVLMAGVERAATALGLLARYAGLLFYPVGLSADYSGPVIPAEPALLAFLPLVGTSIILGLAALLLPGRRVPLGTFAALAFLLPYLVVGNLLFDVGTIFAERLMYMPSAGFCLMMGLLLGLSARGPDRGPELFSRRLSAVALAVLLAGLSISAWARCLDWRNDETLFTAALRVKPDSPRAHFIVGKLHGDRGELEQALAHLDRTLELYPDHASALVEKGVLLGGTGDLHGAMRMFEAALRINPANAMAQLDLGIALHRLGRLLQSERSLLKAVRWDPAMSKGWAELGNLYLEMQRHAAAAAAYRRAISLGRTDLFERLRLAERSAGGAGS